MPAGGGYRGSSGIEAWGCPAAIFPVSGMGFHRHVVIAAARAAASRLVSARGRTILPHAANTSAPARVTSPRPETSTLRIQDPFVAAVVKTPKPSSMRHGRSSPGRRPCSTSADGRRRGRGERRPGVEGRMRRGRQARRRRVGMTPSRRFLAGDSLLHPALSNGRDPGPCRRGEGLSSNQAGRGSPPETGPREIGLSSNHAGRGLPPATGPKKHVSHFFNLSPPLRDGYGSRLGKTREGPTERTSIDKARKCIQPPPGSCQRGAGEGLRSPLHASRSISRVS